MYSRDLKSRMNPKNTGSPRNSRNIHSRMNPKDGMNQSGTHPQNSRRNPKNSRRMNSRNIDSRRNPKNSRRNPKNSRRNPQNSRDMNRNYSNSRMNPKNINSNNRMNPQNINSNSRMNPQNSRRMNSRRMNSRRNPQFTRIPDSRTHPQNMSNLTGDSVHGRYPSAASFPVGIQSTKFDYPSHTILNHISYSLNRSELNPEPNLT
jgi:hypothetical protein